MVKTRFLVKTYLGCTQWIGLVVLLFTSGAFGQSRPADFGNQWVRSNPFTLAGWYGTSGDTDLFAGSGQNTIIDYTNNMPTANLHLYAAIYWDLNSDQGVANTKAANSNLTGWNVYDEPLAAHFSDAAVKVDRLKRVLPENLAYVNIGGAAGTGTSQSFAEHIDDAFTAIQPDVLMFTGQYPFRDTGSRFYPYHFESMMTMRERAQFYDVPYFVHLQAFEVAGYGYILPTATEYRVEAYSYLTAGCKGFVNWVYETGAAGTEKGLVNPGGVPSPLYPTAAAVNAEIKNLGPVLTQLESTAVNFVGSGGPTSVIDFADDFESGIGDWLSSGNGTLSIETANVKDGLQSMRIVNDGASNLDGHAQSEPGGETFFGINSPGTEYAWSFDYWTNSGNDIYANLTIDGGPGEPTLHYFADFTTQRGSWGHFSKTIDLHPDSARGYMQLYSLQKGSEGDFAIVDNVKLASGGPVPAGLENWAPGSEYPHMLSIASSNGADALIGAFRDDNDQPYFMLTNLRHGPGLTESQAMGSFNITFDNTVNEIYRLNRSTGQIDVIALTNHSLIDFELGGGSGDLFNYTGDFYTEDLLNLCDFNNDNLCRVADLRIMMAQGDLVAGVPVGAGNQFDLNSNNIINQADLRQWLSLAGTENGYASPFLRGDTDGVGSIFPAPRTVDITDFDNFLNGFTGSCLNWRCGNFNGDNDVDITDFSNHFLPNFIMTGGGTYGPNQSIPEPSTLLLLGMGGLLLAYLCCRRSR